MGCLMGTLWPRQARDEAGDHISSSGAGNEGLERWWKKLGELDVVSQKSPWATRFVGMCKSEGEKCNENTIRKESDGFASERAEDSRFEPSALLATLSAPSSIFTLTSRVLGTLLPLFSFFSTPSLSRFPLDGLGLGAILPSSLSSTTPALRFKVAFRDLLKLIEFREASSEASRRPASMLIESSRFISEEAPSMTCCTSSLSFRFSR